VLDQEERITAKEALQHPYFSRKKVVPTSNGCLFTDEEINKVLLKQKKSQNEQLVTE